MANHTQCRQQAEQKAIFEQKWSNQISGSGMENFVDAAVASIIAALRHIAGTVAILVTHPRVSTALHCKKAVLME